MAELAGRGWSSAREEDQTADVVLLRHGDTRLTPERRFSGVGSADLGLSAAGREQARRAAGSALLQGLAFTEVLTSPLTRCQETAQVIGAALGVSVIIDRDLREMDFGVWEGMTFDEVQARYPEDLLRWKQSADAAPTGSSETFAAVVDRMGAAAERFAVPLRRRFGRGRDPRDAREGLGDGCARGAAIRPVSHGALVRVLLADHLHRRGSMRAAVERHVTPALIVRDDTVPVPQTDARWLELRVQADNAARALTGVTLLPRLVQYLAATEAGDSGVDVIDLGSGTGANQRWLAPRLPFEQHWLLIDHDQALHHHHPVASRTRLLTADVGILASVLNRMGGARLVTCSALLDVLTIDQLEAIGSAWLRPGSRHCSA